MRMESLANELIVDTFEYLSAVDLFRSFHGLNQRFDGLLREYFRVHPYVDFRRGYKEDIQLMCRDYLPMFAIDLRGIYLSNHDTSPQQMDLFVYPLYRLEKLRTITVENISSLETIRRLLVDVQHLSHLTDLHLHRCSIEADQRSLLEIINTIWSLSHLTTVTFDLSSTNDNHWIPPTIISSSIRHLTVRGVLCLQANLALLSEHTPHLASLSIAICNPSSADQVSPIFGLKTLEVHCEDPSVCFRTLLRSMPNLTQLNLRTKHLRVNGEQWQTIIEEHLTQLNSFHLSMEWNFRDDPTGERDVDRVLQTYRTPFWLDEHHWWIQCHWKDDDDDSSVHLYTLPFGFEHFSLEIEENLLVRSTCPTAADFHQVKSLRLVWDVYEEFFSLSTMFFDDLRDLSITFPLNERFLSILPRLDRLTSLEVRIDQFLENDDEFLQLQQILDRTPRLFAMKFHSWPKLYRNEYDNRRVSASLSSNRSHRNENLDRIEKFVSNGSVSLSQFIDSSVGSARIDVEWPFGSFLRRSRMFRLDRFPVGKSSGVSSDSSGTTNEYSRISQETAASSNIECSLSGAKQQRRRARSSPIVTINNHFYQRFVLV